MHQLHAAQLLSQPCTGLATCTLRFKMTLINAVLMEPRNRTGHFIGQCASTGYLFCARELDQTMLRAPACIPMADPKKSASIIAWIHKLLEIHERIGGCMVPISHCVCEEYVAIVKRKNILMLPQMNTCFPGTNIRSLFSAPGSHHAEHQPTLSVYADRRCSFSAEVRKALDTVVETVNSHVPVPPAIDIHYNTTGSGQKDHSIEILLDEIDSALIAVSSLRSVRINLNPDEVHQIGMPTLTHAPGDSLAKWLQRVMHGVVSASFRSTMKPGMYVLILTYRLLRRETPLKYIDCTVRLDVQLHGDRRFFQDDIFFTSYSRMNPMTALSELHLEIHDVHRDWLEASCTFLESKMCTVKRLHVFLASGVNRKTSHYHDVTRGKSSLFTLMDSLAVNTSVTCLSGFPLIVEYDCVALARLLCKNKTITNLENIECALPDAKSMQPLVCAMRYENSTVTSISFHESTLDRPLFRQALALKMLAQRNAAAYTRATAVKVEQ